MISIKDLIIKIKKYNPNASGPLITKAYEFAAKVHEGQRRRSGEPFIVHPVGTAEILTEMGMDDATIEAALLHDVIEDAGITHETIAESFGTDVAVLVSGVTKIGRITFKSAEQAQAENIRKMLVAMAEDIRVIIIKLADRLHNMRTLEYLTPEKQRAKAVETLEIYAPLAHRLGISSFKWELEDRSFAALEPKKYAKIEAMVAERRAEREQYVSEIINIIESEMKKHRIKGTITGRPKHFYSIYQKMVRSSKEFSEIFDLIAVRIMVNDIKDCYAALGIIHSLWTPIPGRFKDYIAMPKFNMYQSLHTTVVGPQGRSLEIQIRTPQMNQTAEFGIAAHWQYKEKGTATESFRERLSWFKQMLEWQGDVKDPREFMETLKIDLFQDEVFVFTPKGKVVSLQNGATPIDFAYSIHTDVGHACIGAKVNGKIVPLGYQLRNGDMIEVLTSKTAAGPSRDWLKIAKTSRARNKIRQWFSKEMREDTEHLGRETLARLVKKQGLDASQMLSTEMLKFAAEELKFQKPEVLFSAIGAGKVSAQHVLTKIIKELSKQGFDQAQEELAEMLFRPERRKTIAAAGVRVQGIDSALIRLARCCNPVPGDKIIGFITRGRGVSVHRTDCSNIEDLMKSPDRMIDVSWDAQSTQTFPVEIQVEAMDRTKLLRDISTSISEAGLNIISASLAVSKGQVVIMKFIVEIGNIDHLSSVLTGIKKIDDVFDAYRVTPGDRGAGV